MISGHLSPCFEPNIVEMVAVVSLCNAPAEGNAQEVTITSRWKGSRFQGQLAEGFWRLQSSDTLRDVESSKAPFILSASLCKPTSGKPKANKGGLGGDTESFTVEDDGSQEKSVSEVVGEPEKLRDVVE